MEEVHLQFLSDQQPIGISSATWRVAVTFTLTAILLGFVLGVGEGVILLIGQALGRLTERAIGPAILIFAPLADAAAFGLLGGTLGVLAKLCSSGRPRYVSRLAATGVFVIGGYAACVPSRLWLRAGAYRLPILTGIGLLGGTAALIVLKLTRRFLRPPDALTVRRLIRRILILVAAALTGLAISISWIATTTPYSPVLIQPPSHGPNIIMIALDTGRADHFSAYGYGRETTPNLDMLAREGVLFDSAVAPSSWTLPSFASVFTGLLPHQHSADDDVPLARGISTLASILKSRGYQTAGFNANYLVGTARTGIAQGFDTYDDDVDTMRADLAVLGSMKALSLFAVRRTTSSSPDYQRGATRANLTTPFFPG